MDWRIVAAAMAALTVLGGGTLLAAQVQTDLEQGVQARAQELRRADETPPLKLNEFKLPGDLPLEIPQGSTLSPDLSKLTLLRDLDVQLPSDLDLSGLQFELPQDFTLELPEGSLFSPPGLQLPEGATIRLPDGRAFQIPPGSNLDLPPEVIDRLRQQGITPGTLDGHRRVDVRGLPPELTASLDPPQFDGAGRMTLPAGTQITLPPGRQFPYAAGVLPYAARYLLPEGTRLDLPFSAENPGSGVFPVPRPNTRSQLVSPDARPAQVIAVETEITSLPARVRKGEPMTVSGYVRDLAGRPVAGAPVDIFMNETKRAPGVLVGQGQSDGSGTFVITLTLPTDKPAREYQLVNHALGFTDRSGRTYGDAWGDPPFTTYATTTLRLELPARDGLGASTPVTGTLVDNTGAPVIGVPVSISVDGTVVSRPVTNAQGRFATTHVFPAGTHRVEARFLGTTNYDASVIRGDITIEDYAIEVAPILRAKPGDSIVLSGRTLGMGAVAPERTVRVEFLGEKLTLVSDSTGRFSHTYASSASTSPGLYTVRYTLPEHNVEKTQMLELNLTGRIGLDAPTTWDVEAPLPVRVTLTTTAGAPIVGQNVRLLLSGPGGTSETLVKTDADGRASVDLSALRPMAGTYTLTARVANNPYLDAPTASTTLTLGLFEVLWSVPSNVIRGEDASGAATVRFAGRPLAGAAVTLDLFGQRQLVTDGAGRVTWTMRVPESAALGERTLSLHAPDHPTRTTITTVLAVPDLRIETGSTFTPGAPANVKLKLYDDKGAPLRDREITLTTHAPEGIARTVVRTNAAGEWQGPLNLSSQAGNVTLAAQFAGTTPYLGADSVHTMSAAAPTPVAQRGWLTPALVVGLAALAGGGAWVAAKRLPRRAAPASAVAAAAAPLAPTLQAADFEARLGIPESEPRVWGVGEPLALHVRNRGRAGPVEVAWEGGSTRVTLAEGADASTTLTFPHEGDVRLVARRAGETAMEEVALDVRIVDYRKETAREFDLFLEKAQALDPSLTRRSTPREIGWTLAGRMGADAAADLDEIALVMEVTNYSHYAVHREHYLRFVRAARALDARFERPAGG
ncbi:MAG TPA: hypothetical protein VFH78_01860 [Candidatus Thermoplasmatota archaeon]|nr:hypothetical protein [Candidatus Thermoplasmatota archaeon]